MYLLGLAILAGWFYVNLRMARRVDKKILGNVALAIICIVIPWLTIFLVASWVLAIRKKAAATATRSS